MPLIDAGSNEPKVLSLDEQKAAFTKQVKQLLATEVNNRVNVVNRLHAAVWSSGVKVENTPAGAVATKVGLSPEEKVDALNEAGIAVDLFAAAAEEKAHLLKYAPGAKFVDHPNAANYEFSVQGGNVVLAKKQ